MSRGILGIDIGGSGIKANLVDHDTGKLLSERHKILTPQPSTPSAVADVVAAMLEVFDYEGIVGCAFPAIVRHGVTLSAANVDDSWIGAHAEEIFEARTGGRGDFTIINDADAAALAEARFGAAAGTAGVVLVLTFGTGIGSGLLVDGMLVPNTELGHLEFRGHESVEDWAAASARKREDLSWGEWAVRVSLYLDHLDRLFSPDLVVIGGGVSRRWDRFAGDLVTRVEVVPAQFENEAGIVGAAIAAAGRQPTM